MKICIITNNPLIRDKYADKFDLEYFDTQYIDILKKVRDKVHNGHKLLSHPLSGSIKPNETPYKTILYSKESSNLDMKSLSIIEGSIATTEKFLKDSPTPNWNPIILEDFQIVDLSLIENVLRNNLL